MSALPTSVVGRWQHRSCVASSVLGGATLKSTPVPTWVPQNCAVVAEKPSVARDISKVLGATQRRNGFFYGNGLVVTWAIGHLVHLAEPHQINPAWKEWRRSLLPMLPDEWPLLVDEERADQFSVVKKVLNSPKVERVVCATDAGREGELIFRQLYEVAGSSKPVDRLWISSLTPDAIRRGFQNLQPASGYDDLAAAARARSRADWLVGMNLTRAYTLDHDQSEVLSVGRVQTPTLAMLVEREIAIRDFVPEDYLEVHAEFDAGEGRRYRGVYFRLEKGKRQQRLPADGKVAAEIVARARAGRADIVSVKRAQHRQPPPHLYDLAELQRHANRLYGFSAERTLGLAQALYEKHKAITYPRTDSRFLSSDIASQGPQIASRVAQGYDESLVAGGTGTDPLPERFVNDAKVTDHHAIIPTGSASGVRDGSAEAQVLDLINRRFLQAWHSNYRYSSTTLITRVAHKADADQYLSTGKAVDDPGWKVLDVKPKGKRDPKSEPDLPGGLRQGQRVEVQDAEAVKKRTKPPPRFTDATLLTAMESAGKTLDSQALSDAMKERGIGTAATRASIIETLLKRSYIEREKKNLRATEKGIRLLEVVHPKVRSPQMTGEWEAKLRSIERGDGGYDRFIRGIEEFVRDVVGGSANGSAPASDHEPAQAKPAPGPAQAPDRGISRQRSQSAQPEAAAVDQAARPRATPPPEAGEALRRPQEIGDAGVGPPPQRRGFSVPPPAQPARSSPSSSQPKPVDVSPSQLRDLLRSRFGHDSFRPNQEAVCHEVVAGRDVLLVMPTGAGKSLCYQLPGIARGETTIVISPLIALMEDQTGKLRQQGFRAERIHSGRDRLESRRVCKEYMAGELDFLYIAPERLAVPGFPEFLAKRTPGLVAIDEAHCISMWGHDFRPEYRRLRERLPSLRPAPVVALTATATPIVQRDVIDQLGLQDCKRSIHGFRRENLQIELVELVPSLRPSALARLMLDDARRPAIVYAPTRKAAEAQAELLQSRMSAAAYHAGMPAEDRDRVQAAFLRGDLEVIVATIAFGMGIDKPDVRTVVHTGLPGSIEGYYQEIGRAGRDGLPSKAVMLHSWADRKTHEFFLERDYPEPAKLEALFNRLGAAKTPISDLAAVFSGDAEEFERALEKLWMHGGVRIDGDERAAKGDGAWLARYQEQRDYKIRQLDQVTDFTRSNHCRMLDLVRHFDDLEDSLKPCQHCDNCDPETCAVKTFRPPTPKESAALDAIRTALVERDGQSVGKVFRECVEPSKVDRKAFERLVDGLAKADLARVDQDSFINAQGESIEFRRIWLTPEGRGATSLGSRVSLPAEGAGLGPAKKASRSKKAAPRSAAAKRNGSRAKKQFGLGEVPARGDSDELIASALRAWRKTEANKRGMPAFRVFPDRTLNGLVDHKPSNEAELLEVPGVGPAVVKKYGQQLLRVIRSSGA